MKDESNFLFFFRLFSLSFHPFFDFIAVILSFIQIPFPIFLFPLSFFKYIFLFFQFFSLNCYKHFPLFLFYFLDSFYSFYSFFLSFILAICSLSFIQLFFLCDIVLYIPHTKILAMRLVEMQSHDQRYFAYYVK